MNRTALATLTASTALTATAVLVATGLAAGSASAGPSAVQTPHDHGISASYDSEELVIRYLSTNPRNTDLDLGKKGPGAGDQQVFVNDAVKAGATIGYESGACQLTLLKPRRLVASCASTLVLSDGTITMQGVFAEDPSEGPQGLRFAVTGGTGAYAGATGEGVGRFLPGTNDVRTVLRLTD